MEIQEIEVVIRPDGKTQLRVRGAKGAACLALTSELETLLGGDVVAREKTAEFHETAPQTTTQARKLPTGW